MIQERWYALGACLFAAMIESMQKGAVGDFGLVILLVSLLADILIAGALIVQLNDEEGNPYTGFVRTRLVPASLVVTASALAVRVFIPAFHPLAVSTVIAICFAGLCLAAPRQKALLSLTGLGGFLTLVAVSTCVEQSCNVETGLSSAAPFIYALALQGFALLVLMRGGGMAQHRSQRA